MKKILIAVFFVLAIVVFQPTSYATNNLISTLPTTGKGTCECCNEFVTSCSGDACACQLNEKLGKQGAEGETGSGTLWTFQESFMLHREWLVKNVWEAHVLPSMMLSTQQITTVAMQQMMMIGSFFDAKHQLETQRLLQDLQTIAHKEYQPSTGMCRFGTNTRSLPRADRAAEFTQIAIAARNTERTLLNENTIGTGSARDEQRTRRENFRTKYCNPRDLGGALDEICENTDIVRMNKDINYTKTLEEAETIDVNFMGAYSEATATEEDIFALASNLYGSDLMSIISRNHMADNAGNIRFKGAKLYMDTRSIAAKRSVAHNSFAAQVGYKTKPAGGTSVTPYMEEILLDMGIPATEVSKMLGDGTPSYNAQMEVLTKKLYQHPNFYADLYDKPANIDRKIVAMQAIGMMQRRDMYRSQLRSEANSAIFLETLLEDLQDLQNNQKQGLTENTRILYNLGLGEGP